MFPVGVKEVSFSLAKGKWGTCLESGGKDAGRSRVEAEAALDSPHRGGLRGALSFVLLRRIWGIDASSYCS